MEKGRGDKKGTYPKHGECEREEKVHDFVAAINGLSIDVCWEKNEIDRRCCAITQTHPVKSNSATARKLRVSSVGRTFGPRCRRSAIYLSRSAGRPTSTKWLQLRALCSRTTTYCNLQGENSPAGDSGCRRALCSAMRGSAL